MTAPAASSAYQEIADVIGEAAAGALVRELGGIRIYVPMRVSSEHPVFLAVGAEAAPKLAEYFGGLYIDLPKNPHRQRSIAERHRQVYELYDDGLNIQAIALATDFTRGHVYKLLAARRASPANQFDLFASENRAEDAA